MHKIPVTVVTGFLGSGKTTLVRHLLRHNQGRRIAILVNEFGEVGIDGELLRDCQICDQPEDGNGQYHSKILELTNGCLCCTVQEEFLPTMQELLKRRHEIDCILIETSGLALPKPLIQAFRWPEIRTGATVDGVITVVDGDALARGQMVGDWEALQAQRQGDDRLEHETPIEELFEDQLACADMVLLTKSDILDSATRDRLQRWLEQQVPAGVKVVSCQQGAISPDILLGFNAAVEDNLHSRPSRHDTEADHDHDDNINSVSIELEQTFDPTELVTRLKGLVQEEEIYRIKGFVAVPHKAMRLVLQGVGPRFDQFYDRPWKQRELRKTRLVFIGHGLDKNRINQAMSAMF